MWEWTSGADVIQNILRNTTLIWSGNSVRRHTFMYFSNVLEGKQQRVGNASNSTSVLDWYDRDLEKKMCPKDAIDAATFSYDKPGCSSGCCGACSCATSVHGLQQYFVWQQQWFDAQLKSVWENLISVAGPKKIVLVMNAGLILAWTKREGSLPILIQEAVGLKEFITNLPDHVSVIYLKSSKVSDVDMDSQNMFMRAQDAVLEMIFRTITPMKKQPIVVDLYEMTRKRIDFVDSNHYTGRSSEVEIDMILHVLHYAHRYRTRI